MCKTGNICCVNLQFEAGKMCFNRFILFNLAGDTVREMNHIDKSAR
jgi:hypothetical protein